MERPFCADGFRSSASPRLQRVAGFWLAADAALARSWVYLQTLNFVFWNVLAVVCSDDYCTHDAVDALRRLGVPHNRQSLAYRIACGWWPRDFWNRCLYVTLAWTGLFGGVPLIAFLITPPYHKEQASKTAFVLFVTLWSSGVGAALSTLVCVRAAGEGTSSPFYVRCEPSSGRAPPAAHALAQHQPAGLFSASSPQAGVALERGGARDHGDHAPAAPPRERGGDGCCA